MKVRALFAAVLPAVAAVVMLSGGAASASTATAVGSSSVHHAGRCYAAGGFAICSASGTATRPVSIHLHVKAEPNQKVSGAWDVVCSKGLGVGSKSGSFSGTTPLRRVMRQNYTHPDSCIVSADAQLSQNGNHIRLRITYRR